MTGGIVALHSGWRLCHCDRRALPSRPPRPRRLRVRARGRAGAGRSDAAAAAGADRASARAADRAADQHSARGPARRGADPARPDLRQARAVPGDAARRRRRRAGARSRIAAGQDGAVPAGRGRSAWSRPRSASRCRSLRVFGPPVAAASIAQVHRAEVVDRRRPQSRRGEGAAARHRAALPRRPRSLHLRGAATPRACRRKRGGCA